MIPSRPTNANQPTTNAMYRGSRWRAALLGQGLTNDPRELAELQQLDVDLLLLGFSDDELAQLLDPGVKQGLTAPDDIPAPRDETTTESPRGCGADRLRFPL